MEHEVHEEKIDEESFTKSKKRIDMTEKLRDNPWIMSTIVLGIFTLILLFGNTGGVTGKVISTTEASDYLVNYFESQGVTGLEINSISKDQGFYVIEVDYEGQIIPFYVTKDGYLTGNSIFSILPYKEDSSTPNSNGEVTKSEVPLVELFIWSYCPYGVQAQVPFAEVASLLGDYADFKIIPYYDGHGAHETEQNKIQSCIQNIAPDKYWDYASAFVENIYPNCGVSRDVNCDKTESVKLMDSLGIDSSSVLSCVSSQGQSLNDVSSQYASQLGVTGSPTLIINGVKINVARNSEAFKEAICSSFNNPPEECGVVLEGTSSSSTNSDIQC